VLDVLEHCVALANVGDEEHRTVDTDGHQNGHRPDRPERAMQPDHHRVVLVNGSTSAVSTPICCA
jgi:hypothetical protein